MAIRQGNSDVSALYLGSTEITKVYRGATEIYSAAPAPSSLISLDDIQFYFPFNGTVVDESGNENTLTRTPSVFDTGQFEQALFVDNNVGNTALLTSKVWNVANSYSICAWVKQNVSSGDQQIITNDGSFQAPRCWQFRTTQGGKINLIRFDSNEGVAVNVVSSSVVPNSVYTHVAATFSTTNGTKLYINGTQDGSNNNLTPNNDVLSAVCIGSGSSGVVGGAFNGSIDEAMLYSRELTPVEISTLAAGTAPLIS